MNGENTKKALKYSKNANSGIGNGFFDVVRVAHHGDDHVTPQGDLFRVGRPHRTLSDEGLRFGFCSGEDRQGVPIFQTIATKMGD